MRRKQFRGNHKTALERGGNIIMKKRIISLAAAAVFVLGTLAGCGNSSTQTTDKTAYSDASSSGGDLVTVRDAVMTGQLDQYATEIGLWQGIFEKYGIDLQTTEFVAGINTIDAVVNGTADIGMMADYAAVNRLGNTLDATNLHTTIATSRNYPRMTAR